MFTKIDLSHYQGVSCLWENGGAIAGFGIATIIASPTGAPKKALQIQTGFCTSHALIPVEVGDLVVTARREERKIEIVVSRIDEILPYRAITEEICSLRNGMWTGCLSRSFRQPVEAALKKASELGCESARYIA